MVERSKYFIKRLERNMCKPVTKTTILAMWNASTEFNPEITPKNRKAMIMYFWVRSMSANLHHWKGWQNVHFYAEGMMRQDKTREWWNNYSHDLMLTDQSPEAKERRWQGYQSWAKMVVRNWQTKKDIRAKFVKALNLLSNGGAWKKYADVSVPAFDRWMKGYKTLTK